MATEKIKPTTQGIEQIREIIFGEQIDKFERAIDQLQKECNELRQRLEQLESKERSIDQMLAADHEQQQAMAASQQQLREFIATTKIELEKKIADLFDSKVDKTQIGQAFIEWGMKVKQSTTEND
ncbi:MAG: hypothetical protein ONB16_01170 [candidate division KSB1 bacterium]|nr:hypothetical protein [candidate division KSB1 bacterium]MDZ7319425.1 hypothetical protein [candidate division KSB1 bacterium]MDZ7340043.1 hypothetical protein [candidate division KSB1 bacterium]